MKPLTSIGQSALCGVRALLFDIDDTLTTRGALTAKAYGAMERAQEAGLIVVPITGRPAGWCDHIARLWPVDAVVGENGAFWFYYDAVARKLQRRFIKDDATRNKDRVALEAIAARIFADVPGSAYASDQAYRAADIAIDYCEDVPRLPDDAIAAIKAALEAAGLQAKVSSIHVNAWVGGYDKLSTARLLFRERFGIDLDMRRDECLFVGDSPNDQPMFEFFPLSVGVANVRDFTAQMTSLPGFVTAAGHGAGFAEVVDALLSVRAAR